MLIFTLKNWYDTVNILSIIAQRILSCQLFFFLLFKIYKKIYIVYFFSKLRPPTLFLCLSVVDKATARTDRYFSKRFFVRRIFRSSCAFCNMDSWFPAVGPISPIDWPLKYLPMHFLSTMWDGGGCCRSV